MEMIKEEGDSKGATETPFAVVKKREIPNWHILKLAIIGKACSGKKTQV